MPELVMPRLSDSMEEGTIIRWLVTEGAEVAVGEEIVEIETDKATMTYEADAAGPIHFAAREGETLAIGSVIATVGADVPVAATAAAPVVAAVTSSGSTPLANDAPSAVAPVVAAVASAAVAVPGGRVRASPVARRMAVSRNIDLATLVGSGPDGRIVKCDVEAVPATATVEPTTDEGAFGGSNGTIPSNPPDAPAAEAAVADTEARAEAVVGGARGAVTEQVLSRVQQTIARRMAEAKATMPDFTLTIEVDMEAAVELRGRFKELAGGQPVPSYNDFVIKACAAALRVHPRANGAYRDGRFEMFERVNVGFAVAAHDALLVPTVLDADHRSLGEIARDTRRLAAAAREGRLTAADLGGGTFSVSNLGMFGVTHFTAVLNPPQAAILAVGALERRPVVRDGAIVAGERMTITLSCDHRILYGADAAAFLADIRANLEQPLRLAF